MNIVDMVKFVYKNMIHKKGRVFLTISGIIIGIFTFTFFLFVSQGLSNAISDQFSSMGTNMIYVQEVGAGLNGPPVNSQGLTDVDVSKIKQVVREYKYVAPAIMYSGRYEYSNQKENFMTVAYPEKDLIDVVDDLGFEILEGRMLKSGDKGVVVIGFKLSQEGFDDKVLKVGNSLKLKGKSFKVIGILKEQGNQMADNVVLMPIRDMKVVSGQSTYGVIRIGFYDGADLDFYKKRVLEKLNHRSGEKRVEVGSANDIIEQMNQIIGLLTAIISFISSIALVVGGINVMNTMYSNVVERVNEISVMKALGATNSDVRYLFMFESLLLGFIGSVIGFMMSYLFAKFLGIIATNLGYNVPIYFDTLLFIIVILFTSIFACLFGTYPAIKASNVNPSDNLRDD